MYGVNRTDLGIWKSRISCLHSEIRLSHQRACTGVVACCVLHNIAIGHFSDSLPFGFLGWKKEIQLWSALVNSALDFEGLKYDRIQEIIA